jgi:hypothetical protein
VTLSRPRKAESRRKISTAAMASSHIQKIDPSRVNGHAANAESTAAKAPLIEITMTAVMQSFDGS